MKFENPEKRLELLYRCRDFELSHLWQRSVFLGAFLLLCLSGYACFAGSKIGNVQQYAAVYLFPSNGDNHRTAFLWNIIALGICLIGLLMSIIWILMAKSSKMWYEIYEKYIIDFETQNPDLYIDRHYRMGAITGLEKEKVSDSIFSCKSGCYSPSKLNIAIGHVSMYIWIICGLIHLIAILLIDLNVVFHCITACIPFAVICVCILLKKFTHSSTLHIEQASKTQK